MIRFILKHLIELCIFSGLVMLLGATLTGWYLHMRDVQKITSTHTNLKTLVDALQLYSFDNPNASIFPPTTGGQPGVVLCPVPDNNRKGLSFLTTPTAYLSTVPQDPFMGQSMGKSFDAPAVLHWVKKEEKKPFTHIGWGAMSVGPAMILPPQYSVHVLREVPFSTAKLNHNIFDTSNGLKSIGILYHDSLGNSNHL